MLIYQVMLMKGFELSDSYNCIQKPLIKMQIIKFDIKFINTLCLKKNNTKTKLMSKQQHLTIINNKQPKS